MSKSLNLSISGNPFVDAGIYALTRLSSEKKISDITYKNIQDGIKIISDLYLQEGWKKNMISIFPNSKLTNNSVKNKKKEYLDELMNLYDNIGDISSKSNCIGCGRRKVINQYGKRDIPLYGSGALRNYSSFMCDGADYCPLCVLLIQFMPLMLYQSGGKFILLHSNSERVMRYWSNKTFKNYNNQIVTNDYKGCFDEEYKNPINGIFHVIEEIVRTYDRKEWKNEYPSLIFYYFTNYNQKPDLELYSFPNEVFRFLTYIPSDEIKNWNNIIYRQYVGIKKGDEKEYKNKKNRIYENLLYKRSILRYFYDYRERKTFCSWNLLKYYLMEVENMDEKRIESIRTLGDSISEYIEKFDEKKELTAIETTESYSGFTNILRKIMKNKIEKSNGELLCTYDDFVYNICPDFKLWKETRDLLLFRLYENLNEYLMNKDEEDDKNGQ